jgi:SAM-dependent methyltransferase
MKAEPSRPSPLHRLARVLRSLRKEASDNPIVLPLWRSVLLRPLPFFLWFRLRWHWYSWRGRSLEVLDRQAPPGDHIGSNVIPYNVRKMRGFDRRRTERLMNVLRSIHELDVKRARVLNIGPRNEMELLLLRLYGFRADRITAVDLFSYSPLIQVMDMHELAFPDDAFDVTYCAYTLRYSDRPERACREIVRCTREGGFVAASFVTEANPGAAQAPAHGGEREAIVGARLSGGVEDLLSFFGSACERVYWREEYRFDGPVEAEKHCSVIFRVSKDAPTARGPR